MMRNGGVGPTAVAVRCAWLAVSVGAAEDVAQPNAALRCTVIDGVLSCGQMLDIAPHEENSTEIHLQIANLEELGHVTQIEVPGYNILVDMTHPGSANEAAIAAANAAGSFGPMLVANLYSLGIVILFCAVLAAIEVKFKVVGKGKMEEVGRAFNTVRDEADHAKGLLEESGVDLEAAKHGELAVAGDAPKGKMGKSKRKGKGKGTAFYNPMQEIAGGVGDDDAHDFREELERQGSFSPTNSKSRGPRSSRSSMSASGLEQGLMGGVHHKVDKLAQKHGGDSVAGKVVAKAVNHAIDKEASDFKQSGKDRVTGTKNSAKGALSPRSAG